MRRRPVNAGSPVDLGQTQVRRRHRRRDRQDPAAPLTGTWQLRGTVGHAIVAYAMMTQRTPRMNDAIRNDAIRAALARGGIIDLTTTGRKSGEPRRIEIVLHAIDGRIVISGMPRAEKRAWLANVEADARVTIHLKRDVVADLAGAARVITEEEERRALLAHVARAWGRDDLEVMVRDSPLIEVVLDDPATIRPSHPTGPSGHTAAGFRART